MSITHFLLGAITVLLLFSCGGSSDVEEVNSSNIAPIAVIEGEVRITAAKTYTFTGNKSIDEDGSIASYAWKQISGETVEFDNPSSSEVTFTAPQENGAVLVIELTVTDNSGAKNSTTFETTIISLPDLSVNIPVKGQYYGDMLSLSGTVNKNELSEATVIIDAEDMIYHPEIESNGEWGLDITISKNTVLKLTANAEDSAGISGKPFSSELTIKPDIHPETFSIDSDRNIVYMLSENNFQYQLISWDRKTDSINVIPTAEPLPYPIYEMVFDATTNQLIMLPAFLPAADEYSLLYSYDIKTGKISSLITGDDTKRYARSFAYNSLSGDAFFINQTDDEILSINIDTKEEKVITQNISNLEPKLALNDAMYEGLVLTGNNELFVNERNSCTVIRVDIATGERNIVSSAESSPPVGTGESACFREMAVDSKGRILVGTRGIGELYSVDLKTGNRSSSKEIETEYRSGSSRVIWDDVNQEFLISLFKSNLDYNYEKDEAAKLVAFNGTDLGDIRLDATLGSTIEKSFDESVAYSNTSKLIYGISSNNEGSSILSYDINRQHLNSLVSGLERIRGLIFVEEKNALFYTSQNSSNFDISTPKPNELFKLDLISKEITKVAELTEQRHFISTIDIEYNSERDSVYVAQQEFEGGAQLLEVNLDNGQVRDVTIFDNSSLGEEISAITTVGDIVYISDERDWVNENFPIKTVNIDTGEISTITGSFDKIPSVTSERTDDMLIDESNSVLYISGISGIKKINIDSGETQYIYESNDSKNGRFVHIYDMTWSDNDSIIIGREISNNELYTIDIKTGTRILIHR